MLDMITLSPVAPPPSYRSGGIDPLMPKLSAESAGTLKTAGEAAAGVLPDGWLLFLAGLHGIATTHFGIKRKTDFRVAAKHEPRSPDA